MSLIFRSLLLLIFLSLSPMATALSPINIDSISGIVDLNKGVIICRSAAEWSADRALSECNFQQVLSMKDLSPGFSDEKFWILMQIRSPDGGQMRLLEIGHPRLESVTLHSRELGGEWQREKTGLKVAMDRRPVQGELPIFRLNLEPDTTYELLIEVKSSTSINLNSRLWRPDSYRLNYHNAAVMQSIALGGMLVAALLPLIIYLGFRHKAYLFFCISMLAEGLVDASYTGLLQTHLWPGGLPFDMRGHALGIGIVLWSFALFVHHFIDKEHRHPLLDRLLVYSAWLVLLIALASIPLGYGLVIKPLMISILFILILSLILLLIGWRRGAETALYLLIGYGLLLLMLLYRIFVAFGILPHSGITSSGYSWYFLAITPAILIGFVKQSQRLEKRLHISDARVIAGSQFISKVSHELRSPLISIINIISRHKGKISKNEVSTIDRGEMMSICNHADDMLAMVDEILDYARSENNNLMLDNKALPLHSFRFEC
jgi:two-component system, sensor histidine kinase LadS